MAPADPREHVSLLLVELAAQASDEMLAPCLHGLIEVLLHEDCAAAWALLRWLSWSLRVGADGRVPFPHHQ